MIAKPFHVRLFETEKSKSSVILDVLTLYLKHNIVSPSPPLNLLKHYRKLGEHRKLQFINRVLYKSVA